MRKAIIIILLTLLAISIQAENAWIPKHIPFQKIDENIIKTKSKSIYAIVLFDGSLNLEGVNVTIKHKYKIISGALVYGSKEEILKLAARKNVKSIWNNSRVWALGNPRKLWASIPMPLQAENINATGANKLWDFGYLGENVVVAVLDTGIDWTHPDLDDLDDNPNTTDPKIIVNVSFVDYDFDGNPDEDAMDYFGHGTHVAGIIAGTGEASNGTYRGIAPKAKLMNIKVLDKTGSGYWDWVIRGIEYATFGPDGIPNTGDEADIINLSLGGIGFLKDPVCEAVERVWENGVVVVVAAGNEGFYYEISSPGLAHSVITVGASDNDGNLAYFSSRGPSLGLVAKPDILAPGVGVIAPRARNTNLGTPINDYYTQASGTSMATPHVAGAVALLLQAFPYASNNLIKLAILASARDLGLSSYEQGFGFLDVYSAYLLLNGTYKRIKTEVKRSLSAYSVLSNEYFEARFFDQLLSNYMFYKISGKNNVYLERMALRYELNGTISFYWFSSLKILVPLMTINSNVYYEKLETPDEAIMIEAFIINTTNEWFYILLDFNFNSSVEWLAVYLGVDIDVMEVWDDNNVTYLNDIDAGYAFYSKNYSVYFGVVALNKTIAHHVGEFWTMWSAIADDSLNNETSAYGDIGLAMKWNLTRNGRIGFAFVFARDNSSNFAANALLAKENESVWSITSYGVGYVMIESISYMRPLSMENNVVNVTLINLGNKAIEGLIIGVYLDENLLLNQSTSIGYGERVTISLNFSVGVEGIHTLYIVVFDGSKVLDEFLRPLIIVPSTKYLIAPMLLSDYPLELRYLNQNVIYNLTIIRVGDANISLNLNSSLLSYSLSRKTNSSQLAYNLRIETISAGTEVAKLIIIENGSEIFEANFRIRIEDRTISYEILSMYAEETESYRVPDFDGVIEADEDAEIILNIRNSGNESFYAYLVHANFNDTNVLPMPQFGSYKLFNPGDSANITISYYIFPEHEEGVIESYQILYVSFGEAFPFHMGYPADIFISDIRVKPRMNGTPLISVASVKIEDAGDKDGYIEPGETVYVTFNATNEGNGSAIYVQVFGYQNVTGFVATAHLRTLPAMDPGTNATSRHPIYHWISDSADTGYVEGQIKIVYYDLSGNEYTTVFTYIFFCGLVSNLVLEAELPKYIMPNKTYLINVTIRNEGEAFAENLILIYRTDEIDRKIELGSLEAGGEIKISLNLSFEEEGYHSIHLEIKALNIYEISDEDNFLDAYVIVDGTPPEINILYPQNNTFINSDFTVINIHVYDELSGIMDIIGMLDNVEVLRNETSKIVYDLSEGIHEFKAFAIDKCGNIADDTTTFIVDKTPPEINIDISNGTVFLSGRIEINWTVKDNFGVDKIYAYLNGELIGNFSSDISSINLELDEGEYYFVITAYDKAGNMKSAFVFFTVKKPKAEFKIEIIFPIEVSLIILIIVFVLAISIIIAKKYNLNLDKIYSKAKSLVKR